MIASNDNGDGCDGADPRLVAAVRRVHEREHEDDPRAPFFDPEIEAGRSERDTRGPRR